jgi:predicted Zn-dependent protease
MLDQELLSVARQDPYLRTHPLSRDRLEFVREQLARGRQAGAALPAGFEERFAMVQAKLDGFLGQVGGVRGRRYAPGDMSAPGRYYNAIAFFRAGQIQPAVELLDSLIREQPGNPYLHEMKGQVLFEGHRAREALAPYREAARLAPGEPQIRTSLARVMIELGEPALLRQAVAELEASLRFERDSAFTWRQLGIARGRLGQMPLADLALAEEAILLGDFPGARMLARRAENALPPGPARLRAQDLRNAARPENMTREDRRAEDAVRRGERR